MSISQALLNNNRIVSQQLTTPLTPSTSIDNNSIVYATFHNVPIKGKIKSIKVTVFNSNSNLAVADLKVIVFSNSAKYRAIAGINDYLASQFILNEVSVLAPNNGTQSMYFFDMKDSPYYDETNVGCLHLGITRVDASVFSPNTKFVIQVFITPELSEFTGSPFRGKEPFRILFKDGITNTVSDYTANLLGQTTPYGAGYSQSALTYDIFKNTNDTLYIGMATPYSGFFVDVVNQFSSGITYSYSTTNGFVNFLPQQVLDNTSDGTAPTSFSYSGAIKFVAQPDWASIEFNGGVDGITDPTWAAYKYLNDNKNAYTVYPNVAAGTKFNWIKLAPIAGTGATIKYIKPLK